MSRRLKSLAVLFSLVLNVAFVGAFSYHRFLSDHGEGHRGARERGPLIERLDLTPEQRQRFIDARDEFHGRLDELGGDLQTHQLELIDLLAADEVDAEALQDKRDRIAELQARIQALVLDHLLAESAILEPEQRQELFRLLRENITSARGSPLPWLPSTRSPRNGGHR